MARFPRTEPEVMALVMQVISGLNDNAAIYPAPPVSAVELGTLFGGYNAAKNAQTAALAAAEDATNAKDDALEALTDATKTDLRYAENTTNGDDDKLKLLGWSGRKAPSVLTPPGQTKFLEAPRQGAGWVFLDWKKPSEGGAVSAYKVMRRERPEGAWSEVATAVISEITLVEQPTGKELEYRIIAVNKAGDGHPSDTVMVVM